MDTSTYDAQIQVAIDEKNALYSQMEQTCATYFEASGEFFKNEFQRMIEREVTSKPDVTQKLGLEKLKELKAEVNELVENAPQLVSEHFDKDNLWEHRCPLPEGMEKESLPGFDLTHSAGKKVIEEVREVLGYSGRLIIKYGYKEAGREGEWESRGESSRPRYRYGFSTAKEMDDCMMGYKEQFKKFVSAHLKIIKLQKEKEQAIAKDLWSQA
jgi:hypothetical protein